MNTYGGSLRDGVRPIDIARPVQHLFFSARSPQTQIRLVENRPFDVARTTVELDVDGNLVFRYFLL